MKKIILPYFSKETLKNPIFLLGVAILFLASFPLSFYTLYLQNQQLEELKQRTFSLQKELHKKNGDPALLLLKQPASFFLEDFLKTIPNLTFNKGEEKKIESFKELELTQDHPIEIDEEELKSILSFLENKSIHPYSAPQGAPQFLIKSFNLEKVKDSEGKENKYSFYTKIIQRQKNT